MPTDRTLIRSATRATVLAVACLALIGCSDDEFPPRYKVSGTITYKGEPLKKGSITFTPEGQSAAASRAASGTIEDGYYSLTTVDPGDGAFAGSYGVSVTSDEVDLTKAIAAAKITGGAIAEDQMVKAKRTSGIPRKYNTPSTSGLKAEVKSESNTLNFALD